MEQRRLSAINIVLIGMPAAGKTVVGRILANRLHRPFIDTDLLLEERCGLKPSEMLASFGREAFRQWEEAIVLGVGREAAVVATGGSVVYSPRAMAHLSAQGVIVYLFTDLAALSRRGLDLAARGVVRAPGQDLASLYAERVPLYERFADLVIDARSDDAASVTDRLLLVLATAPSQEARERLADNLAR